MTAEEKFELWWSRPEKMWTARGVCREAYLAGYLDGRDAAQQLAEADRAEVETDVRLIPVPTSTSHVRVTFVVGPAA